MNPFRKFAVSKQNFHKANKHIVFFRSRYYDAIKPEKLKEIDTFLQLWGENKLQRIAVALKVGYPYEGTFIDKAIVFVKMLLY